MKSWTIVFSLIVCLFSSLSARADLEEALKIHADYFPNREYSIGLDVDANHLISRIYFQDQNANQTFFSLESLANFTTIFSIGGIDLVRIRISERPTPYSATIEMSYTRSYLRGLHESLFFNVQFNPQTSHYTIVDRRSGQIVTEADVTTRYSAFLPIGISSVDTR